MKLDDDLAAALGSLTSNASANDVKPAFYSVPKLADMPSPSTSSGRSATLTPSGTKVPIRRTTKAEQEIIMTMALSGKKPLQIAEALGLKANTVSKFLERKKKKTLKNTDHEALQLLMQSSPPRQRGSR
ncbi:oxidoreductase [Pseudozyma hubeiensis SY62]|uniref:Oxidoreductase n=1 Tax=Pseudozyma hubeiensis (strain SY62) TaxID=1305764 RepID=R9P5Y8_PSEHS|nr:oxidoreductase [Pseudozyma hubeiensis SY62]GAC96662.1 oxidoreductase [Pseudozyma hubeiensis SY62]